MSKSTSSAQKRVHRYESPFFPIEDEDKSIVPAALIILNTPIKCTKNNGELSGVLFRLWEASAYRVCADGGANRLFDATVARSQTRGERDESTEYIPDFITGDLDSLREDVRQYYEAKGVSILRVEDQNFHDLDVRISYNVFFFVVYSLPRAWITNGTILFISFSRDMFRNH